MIAACLLTACGPSTQSSDDVPDPNERALPYGAIIAVGENWQVLADPDVGAVSLYVDDGVETSGVWSPPQAVSDGYVMTAGDLMLSMTEEACELNGAAYPMRATVNAGANSYTGCAAMRWDYQLIALMPQIDACIAQSPETRWVTYAGVEDGRAVFVRLQDGETMIDCRVIGDAAAIGPRDETRPMPTESAAIFVRAPGVNPGGECYEAPEVRTASGELLGWKVDPMGC